MATATPKQPQGLPAIPLAAYSPAAFTGPRVAVGQAVCPVTLQNLSAIALTNQPFAFGQVFAQGDLAPTDFLLARAAGKEFPLQFNPLATWQDGSVRHAAISGVLPNIDASQMLAVDLVRTTTGPKTSNPTPDQFPRFDVQTSITMTDTQRLYVADANQKGPLTEAHFAGDICSDYTLRSTFRTPTGDAEHPHLTAIFHIRLWHATGIYKVDTVIENTKTYDSTLTDETYDVEIMVAGKSVYKQAGLVHFVHTRWKKQFWSVDVPLHVRHNTPYFIASKMVPNYDQLIPFKDATLADYQKLLADTTKFGPMKTGRFAAYMPTTGGRPDIGIMPDSYVAYILTTDKRAKDMMLASADAGGSWPAHRRDNGTGPAAGRPLDIMHWSYSTIAATTGDSMNPATGLPEKFPAYTSKNPNVSDASHQPGLAYLPYLTTADHYYLEELHFYCNYNLYNMNPAYRNYIAGLLKSEQGRGQGWSMRTLAEAAAVTPDKHYLKAGYNYWYENNLKWYIDIYMNGPSAKPDEALLYNKLGIIASGYTVVYNMNGGTSNGIAPWQDDHFTSSLGHGAELGFVNAKKFLLWKAKFQLGRMAEPDHDIFYSCMYNLQVRDTIGQPIYDNLGICFDKSITDAEFKKLPLYTQQQLDYRNAKRAMPSNPYKMYDIDGYPDSPEGYPADFQPALAMCCDLDHPWAELAWKLFRQRPTKGNYTSSPQFSVVPRRKFDDKPAAYPRQGEVLGAPPVGVVDPWASTTGTVGGTTGTVGGTTPVTNAPTPMPAPAPAPLPTPTPAPAPAPTSVVKANLIGDPGAGTWTKIGNENDTITVPPNTTVRYGANGKYVWSKISGQFKATNSFFTYDPIVGVQKIVEALTPAAQPTPAPAPAKGSLRIAVGPNRTGLQVVAVKPGRPAVVASFQDRSSDATGVTVVTDEAITAGTAYAVVVTDSSGAFVTTQYPVTAV